jgi:serine/threonine-protein kinase
MFHLLTGADPQNNPLLIFDFNKHPRPRQINPRLSDQIEQILMQMVEYNANKRFSGAAELRESLIKHRDNLRNGSVTFGIAPASPSSNPSAQSANQLVFCGFCGQKIVASDFFCPFCGAQQQTAGAQAQKIAPPAYVAPKLTARVMVVSTNDLNAPAFNLEKDTNLVGRRDPLSNIFPEVDLSKFDPQTKISRRHARIWRESDKFMVEDLGSSNGTILMSGSNESVRLAKNQPHILSSGDKIRVGDTTLHFVIS